MINLPKYVTTRKRKGGERFYFQVPKHCRPDKWASSIRLSDDHPEMIKQARELYDRLKAERGGKPQLAYVEGTFPWLLQEYHRSRKYRKLSPRTQELYDWCSKFITDWSNEAGNPHVKHVNRPVALKFLRQFDANPTKKKKIAVMLSVLMAVAVDHGQIEFNPVTELNIIEPDAEVHIWADNEVMDFIAAADKAGFPNVGNAVLMAWELGQRQADVLSMKAPEHYKEGAFTFRQHKTGELLEIPASERLRNRLGRSEGFLAGNRSGGRYTRTGFQTVFNSVREAAGLPHCQFLHLRHTAVVRLARASCTVPEIASITGHTVQSVTAILKRYLPRDPQVAKNAIDKRETFEKR